jgi:hypothetical protein
MPIELLKKFAGRYLDLNEQIATRLFEVGKRMGTAVESTPIYPILEFQQTFAHKAFEYYVKGARSLIEAL